MFTMKSKFIRCDEKTHEELKIYTIKNKKKSISESIKELLEGNTNGY